MKKIPLITAVVLLASVSLAACGKEQEQPANSEAPKPSNAAEEKVDPLGKYSQPLEISVIYERNAEGEKMFIPGSTYENNWSNDLWLNKLNIKPVVKWSAPAGDQFVQKYNLMLASNDLPDVFLLKSYDNKQSARSLLKRLVDSGAVEDLTDVYQKYATEDVKGYYKSFDNKPIDYASFDGKMYGLPYMGDTYGNAQLLWVRQDWLDKLGMKAPTTVEEMVDVARAFKDKDPDGNGKADTYGLAMQNAFLDYGFTNAVPVFSAFKSFPKSWVKDSSGKVVWGGIQPETKQALEVLAGMFKEGLLHPEFALQDGAKAAELLTAGKAGMQLGSWWNGLYPLTFNIDADPKADWKASVITSDGTLHAVMDFPTNEFLVVKKGFKNPEAAVKILNFGTDLQHVKVKENEDRRDELAAKYGDKQDAPSIIPTMQVSELDTTLKQVKVFEDILAGKDSADKLDRSTRNLFDRIKDNHDNPRKDPGKYKDYIGWMSALSSLAHAKLDIQWNAFAGTTPTYDAKMGSLIDKELQTFTKIIMGKEPIDYFDTFVKEWEAQGGDMITQEVNESLAKENAN